MAEVTLVHFVWRSTFIHTSQYGPGIMVVDVGHETIWHATPVRAACLTPLCDRWWRAVFIHSSNAMENPNVGDCALRGSSCDDVKTAVPAW